jgi:hypothetical protein
MPTIRLASARNKILSTTASAHIPCGWWLGMPANPDGISALGMGLFPILKCRAGLATLILNMAASVRASHFCAHHLKILGNEWHTDFVLFAKNAKCLGFLIDIAFIAIQSHFFCCEKCRHSLHILCIQ